MTGPAVPIDATTAPSGPGITPARLKAMLAVAHNNRQYQTLAQVDADLMQRVGMTYHQLIEAVHPTSAPPAPVRSGDVAAHYAHMLTPFADELTGAMAHQGSPGARPPVGADPATMGVEARDAYRAAEARLAEHPIANAVTTGLGIAANIPLLSKLLPDFAALHGIVRPAAGIATSTAFGAMSGADAAPEMTDVPAYAERGAKIGAGIGIGVEGLAGLIGHILAPAASNAAVRMFPEAVGRSRGTSFARDLLDRAGVESPESAADLLSRINTRNPRRPQLSQDLPSSRATQAARQAYAPLERAKPTATPQMTAFLRDPRVQRVWARVAPDGDVTSFTNYQKLRQELRRLSRTVGQATDVQPVAGHEYATMTDDLNSHLRDMWPGLPNADRHFAQASSVAKAFRAGQAAASGKAPLLPHEMKAAAEAAAAEAGPFAEQAREAFRHGAADAELRSQLVANRLQLADRPAVTPHSGGHASMLLDAVLHPKPEAATIAVSERLNDLFGPKSDASALLDVARPGALTGAATRTGVQAAGAAAPTWQELWQEYLRGHNHE